MIAGLSEAMIQAAPQQTAERHAVEAAVEVHVNVGGRIRGPELHARDVGVAGRDKLAQAPAGRILVAPAPAHPAGLVVVHDVAVGVIVLPVAHKRGVHTNAGRAIGDVEIAIVSPVGAPTVLHHPAARAPCVSEAIVPADDQHGVVRRFCSRMVEGIGPVIIPELRLPGVAVAGID